MSTLLLIALASLVGLLLCTAAYRLSVRLFRVERVGRIRILCAGLPLTVAGFALIAGLGFSLLQTGALLVLTWVLTLLILRADAGKSAGVAAVFTISLSAVAAGLLFGLALAVGIYAVPLNEMAPTLAAEHYGGECPHCGGRVVLAGGFAVEGGDFPVEGLTEDGICADCFKVSTFEPAQVAAQPADRILFNRLLAPERWDVVILHPPDQPDAAAFFRVVGMPGEKVEIRDRAVWVDDARVELTDALHGLEYLPPRHLHAESAQTKWRLGPDEFAVLGDASMIAFDSRFFGPVRRDSIEGVVTVIWSPVDRWRILK